jgi:hypothetical protein
MTHEIKLRQIEPVTHDTYRLVFDKPAGYTFEPGQATEFRLDREGWRDEGRPFSFTSQPEDDHLEFTIKTYHDHAGVTREIATLTPGETVLIGPPWGAIHDAGPGTFLAAGTGVTPFIPILRRRARDGALDGCHLIFSNKTSDDIILRGEWEAMTGLETTFVVDAAEPGLRQGPIDADMLADMIGDFSGVFYVCGPPGFIEAMHGALGEHGVSDSQIVKEEA